MFPMMPLGAVQDENPLAAALGKLQANTLGGGGVTLGNQEAQQDYARQLAEAMSQMQQAAQQSGLADSLMRPEYAQNSGALGSLAMMAQAFAGKKLAKRAGEDDAAARERYYKGESALRAQEEAAKEAKAAAAAQAEREGFLADYGQNNPALDALRGIKRPDQKRDWREVTNPDGSTDFIDLSGYGEQQTRNTPTQDAAWREAIAGIESAGSGDYKALGPQTKGGDRAYGRYQVMGANIPEWTQAALGRAMTPEEFIASPEAQDAVFDHRFGGYVQKYGPEGAAKAWFAGEGGMKNPNARDVLGTSVDDYAAKFKRGMGGMQESYQDTASVSTPARIRGSAPQPRDMGDQYAPLSAEETRAMGLPDGTVAQRNKQTGKVEILNKPSARDGGGMPVRAVVEDMGIEDAIAANQKLASILVKNAERMQSGDLEVTPGRAVGSAVRGFFGVGTEKDANFKEWKADMTSVVNEWLRLNKGVQTEGDAQRAFKELMDANDPMTAAKAITRLSGIVTKTVDLQTRKRSILRGNYGGDTQRESYYKGPEKPKKAAGGVLKYNPKTGEFE